jgi:hypothetical protein
MLHDVELQPGLQPRVPMRVALPDHFLTGTAALP